MTTMMTMSGNHVMLWLLELLLGAQEDCALSVEESSNYPHCNGKINVRLYTLLIFFVIRCS